MTDKPPADRPPAPPFDLAGYMRRREPSIDDVAIAAEQRRLLGARDADNRDHVLPVK